MARNISSVPLTDCNFLITELERFQTSYLSQPSLYVTVESHRSQVSMKNIHSPSRGDEMSRPPSSQTTPQFYRVSERDLTEIELHSVDSINDLHRTHAEHSHKGTNTNTVNTDISVHTQIPSTQTQKCKHIISTKTQRYTHKYYQHRHKGPNTNTTQTQR